MSFFNALQGRKTYIAGALAIGLGIYLNNVELIMIGLCSMGLRNAIPQQNG